MQELEIKNVKTAQYRNFNLNQIYDYIGKSGQSFEFQRSESVSPEVVIYPNTGKVRIMTGDMQKSFKIESEVNYLDGE